MQIKQKKYFSRFKKPLLELPDLVDVQTRSYEWLLKQGLGEIFKEFSPINDYSGKKFSLEFLDFSLDEPKFDEYYAKENKHTYETPLRLKVKLHNKALGTEKEQEIFMLDFPLQTAHGTFIINGVERVIVPQLARSFGVMFSSNFIKGHRYFGAKIIPGRGAWIEIEMEQDDCIYVRIDKKRKFPVTSLLRAFSNQTDEKILESFEGHGALEYLKATFAKDVAKSRGDSLVEVYSKLREGDLATPETAETFINGLFGGEKYDLSIVGRFRFNERFGRPTTPKALEQKTLSFEDIVSIIKHIVDLQADPMAIDDDIDHLGSRRVRSVGEMLQTKLRLGLSQIKRNVQDRMSTMDVETTMPVQFITTRPLQARVKEFFTTNQLSQFMSQENILSEIEHLRRMSALGPGGLTRERAGYEVRDVHTSHYGRVCPIETPEGPNIGLILTLASYSRVNDLGIIEAPYAKIKNGKLTGEIIYMNAFDEETHKIAHGAANLDEEGRLLNPDVEARVGGNPTVVPREDIEYMDVAPYQAYSLATAMIPFLEHDDANRALMGSNMQKQATPCIVPEAPLVATGIESEAARFSGRLITAREAGEVVGVDARKITIKETSTGKNRVYTMVNYSRSNQFTIFHQRPTAELGAKVKKGDLLADTSTSVDGQIAIGQNIFVAFMSWAGANYEDAIVLSERLVKESKFSSIHIEEFVCDVRDTKLGPEVTTHDIPNVSEGKLKNLDEEGVVRIGAEVGPNDILVGKITPKGETELTPEERLLRSIFGEKARDVKDSSLRMEHGKRGRIVGIKVFSREKGDKLESGIIKRVYIEVAQLRPISVGDKLSGRHGNKGVVSRVLPEEDMPYMADGTPIDIVLTPLGVPSRMNLGQILEMHLGLAAHTLNYQAITPTFSGATADEIRGELMKAGFPSNGQVKLFDGQTGESFEQDVAVGYMYMLKLHHMVEDKIHMRSIGPYSLITQQPLGGRAQGGGQRFGEMEVWALEGYGAAHTLREMLTIKSDDILGRSAAFDSIVRNEDIGQINLPASFNVLLNELKGLALDVELKKL
ncbi:MAG TPA: DNA-directed RNA polymerase subunit beta [Candidatus Paceibacterota bacterium]